MEQRPTMVIDGLLDGSPSVVDWGGMLATTNEVSMKEELEMPPCPHHHPLGERWSNSDYNERNNFFQEIIKRSLSRTDYQREKQTKDAHDTSSFFL